MCHGLRTMLQCCLSIATDKVHGVRHMRLQPCADSGPVLPSCMLCCLRLWHSTYANSSQNMVFRSVHDKLSVPTALPVVRKWLQVSKHMCYTPQQSPQYIVALMRFFPFAELKTLRLWVDAAVASGPTTESHFYSLLKCRFSVLMACCTKV